MSFLLGECETKIFCDSVNESEKIDRLFAYYHQYIVHNPLLYVFELLNVFVFSFDNIERVSIVKFLRLFSFFVDLLYEIECLPYGEILVGLEVTFSEIVAPFEVISESEGGYDVLISTRLINPFFIGIDDERRIKDIKNESGKIPAGHFDVVINRRDNGFGVAYLCSNLILESLI